MYVVFQVQSHDWLHHVNFWAKKCEEGEILGESVSAGRPYGTRLCAPRAMPMPSMPSCPHKIRILSPRVAWAVCPAQALERAMFYSLKELGNGNSKETICLAAGLDLWGEQMITWHKIFTLVPLMKSKKANSNVICKCGFILEDGIYLSWKKQLLRILINENLLAPQVLL